MNRINIMLAIIIVAAHSVYAMDEVVSISLIDPETDTEIRVLNDGDTIDVNTDGFSIALRANTSPTIVGSVQLQLTGAEFESRVDNNEPFTVHGDDAGSDIFGWFPSLGNYTLTATPYQYGGATGDVGTALSISFTIINDVSSGDPPPVATGAYLESGGLVIMEAETEASASSNWYFRSDVSGYTLDGYYEWKFGDPSLGVVGGGSGVITYEVDITTTGRYRFVIRSAAPDNTDHNDVWVRFPDNGAIKVQGASEGSLGTGWFKVYQNFSGNNWTYQTKTVDFDAHQVHTEFDTPGKYKIEISGRSTLFKVDRLTLYHSTVTEAMGTDPTIPESMREGDDPPPTSCDAPENPSSSVSSTTSASVFWDFVSGADEYQVQGRKVGASTRSIFVPGTSTFLSLFSAGLTYEYRVRALCGTETSAYSAMHTFTMPNARETDHFENYAVFPNPASEFIQLSHSETAASVTLYDVAGQQVLHNGLSGTNSAVSIQEIPAGYYIIQVRGQNNEILHTDNIVVE
jgi:hypothetical protein